MSVFEFQPYDPLKRKLPYLIRNGEKRVGDQIKNQQLKSAKFVLIGISENVGPQANLGRPGSENAFAAFSKVFFNTQFYPDSKIDQLAFLGQINQIAQPNDRPQACEYVKQLDTMLYNILSDNVAANQIPIIVGGGHNNALPLMRWAAKQNPLSVVNIDAHADLRDTDKRHSGNSFSFALEEGLLKNYAVFGLHEAFNNEIIRTQLKQKNVHYRFFEDYLTRKFSLKEDVLNFLEDNPQHIGLELDMDALAFMPSSAFSPSGWSLDEIRSMVLHLGHSEIKFAYLNLTEAAPLDDREDLIVGKALSYLVRDFCASVK